MEIITKKENDIMEISLVGKLDTITSTQLENSFDYNLEGIKEIIFNFKDLEYISSAGLRTLLTISKKTRDTASMVITNISDNVKEVFEITGFISIFTIK